MPEAFDRCVKHVKGQGKAKNAYAVCRASMGTNKDIEARAARRAQLNRVKRGAR